MVVSNNAHLDFLKRDYVQVKLEGLKDKKTQPEIPKDLFVQADPVEAPPVKAIGISDKTKQEINKKIKELDDDDFDVREKAHEGLIAIGKKELSPEELVAFQKILFTGFKDKPLEVQKRVPQIWEKLLNEMTESKFVQFSVHRAKTLNIVPENLPESRNILARIEILFDKEMPGDAIKKILEGESDEFKRNIASVKGIPSSLINVLLQDEDSQIKVELARNPNLSKELLIEVSKTRDLGLIDALTENPNTPKESFVEIAKVEDERLLFNSDYFDLPRKLLNHPNTPKEIKVNIINKLLENKEPSSKSPSFWFSLLNHSLLSPEQKEKVLNKLGQNEHDIIKDVLKHFKSLDSQKLEERKATTIKLLEKYHDTLLVVPLLNHPKISAEERKIIIDETLKVKPTIISHLASCLPSKEIIKDIIGNPHVKPEVIVNFLRYSGPRNNMLEELNKNPARLSDLMQNDKNNYLVPSSVLIELLKHPDPKIREAAKAGLIADKNPESKKMSKID